jgi:hypothetical protein
MAELSPGELERRWQERCRSGKFSPAVLGVGTIRVMGRSGDTPVQFPRIASLDTLDGLEPEEVYAVRAAQEIIKQAREQSGTISAQKREDRLNLYTVQFPLKIKLWRDFGARIS